MPAGQYEFNFTFLIPSNTPSSFKYITAEGEQYSVSYNIHVYFNDPDPLMIQTVDVRVIGQDTKRSKDTAAAVKNHHFTEEQKQRLAEAETG